MNDHNYSSDSSLSIFLNNNNKFEFDFNGNAKQLRISSRSSNSFIHCRNKLKKANIKSGKYDLEEVSKDVWITTTSVI